MNEPRPDARPESRQRAVRTMPTRRRRSGRRFPFGIVIGLALFAAVLQGSGTLDLGIPLGPLDSSRPAGSGLSLPAISALPTPRMPAAVRRAVGAVDPTADEAPTPEPAPVQQAGFESVAARQVEPAAGQAGAAAPDPLTPPLPLSGDPLNELLPALSVRTDGYRSEVERAWFSGGSDLANRTLNARTRALQLGATNYEGASRALLAPSAGGVRLKRALLAVQMAPDLPLARMQLATAYFDDGKYVRASKEMIAGVMAIPRNLEATLWLASSLLAMFAAVLTIGSLAFIVWVGVSVFRHAAHDVGDLVSREMPGFARAALLASLLLVPVALGEAFMGLIVGLFLLGFLYCEAGYRRALTLAAVLLLLGLYPVTRLAGLALTTLDSDPVAAAADSVVRSMASDSDIASLVRAAEQDDWLAEAALALHERRSGDPAVAMARYQRLLERTPTDPVVLAVLSNMHFERGENERSIQLDERAAALVRSATLLFNLSQVYARSFRMDEFEGAMAQAQAVDPEVVADLSRTAAPDFVADLAFPSAPIRDRMIENAGGERFVDPVSRALMPGRLGNSWMATAGGFVLAALLGGFLRGRWEHSSSCDRCGRRICNRCDGTVWNSQICDGCHHLFHRPETTDPSMRMARLSELRQRETRIGRIAVAASLIVPGVGGMLAKRPDLSFLGLLLFGWAVLLLLWRDGIVVDPLAVGAAGPLVFAVAGGFAVLAYALVVFVSLLIRRSL